MMINDFQGERLRIARLFKGISQADLARVVETSRQYIHQIEIGAKSPSQDVLAALAEVLSVSSLFFYDPVLNAVKLEQCHFRKLRTSPAGATRQALAHATLLESLTSVFDSKLELPEVDFPFFEASSFPEIERIAEQCRKHWGLGLTKPVKNMTRVIERSGGIITHFGDLSEKVDAFSINRARPIIVRNTAKGSACRLRFDLAHETGHFVMHQGIETGDVQTEKEANHFASAFLLPRLAFAAEFPKGSRMDWTTIYRMKLRWKVSVKAIIRRACDLGLIDAVAYRKGNIFLSKTGQSKHERYDDQISMEVPTLLEKSLKALKDGFGIGTRELSEILNVQNDFTERLVGELIFEDDPSPPLPDNVIRLKV
ncbi:MAG TPA: XRE family transcriptional regulator [Rhodospirillales bacterium]|nr:XRE family transcriptional regulator [Rhodospirillales bacterium]